MKVFFKTLMVFILFLSPAGAFPLGNNQDGNQEALPGEHVFFLKQEDVSQAVVTISIDIGRRGVEFKKEPDFGKARMIRSVIPLDEKNNIVLPFAWNKSDRILYMDLNRNLDLTDDRDNVFKGTKDRGGVTFSRVRLNIPYKDKIIPCTATIRFGGWDIRNKGEIVIHTTWQGDVELEGGRWRLILADGLDGDIGAGPYDLYNFVPLPQKLPALDYEMHSFPEHYVFLNNKAYQINGSFVEKDHTLGVKVRLVEKEAPLGELQITGQYIRRLVLVESGDLYHVILDNPQERIHIPTGKYSQEELSLWRDSLVPRFNYNLDQTIEVSRRASAIFKAGGPLKNVATTIRYGNRLQLNYELKDADNNKVEYGDINYNNPPDVIVYQNGQKIHSGRFSFG